MYVQLGLGHAWVPFERVLSFASHMVNLLMNKSDTELASLIEWQILMDGHLM